MEAIYDLPRPIGCWRFPVRADARVYEVHTPADWLALCERYPRVGPTPAEWSQWGIEAPYALAPDWTTMARDWDGLHVSMAGLLTTAGLPLASGIHASLLERVDSEITSWLRPCFGTPELLASVAEDDLPM